MRDVRDWYKYVDMSGKAASKRAAAPDKTPRPAEGAAGRDGHGAPPPSGAAEAPAASTVQTGPVPPRKGRGLRKQETLEELLSRLLDPTLTLEETARILEVCPTTVRRYTNKGILAHERSPGNQRRFKLSTVLAFKEAQAGGARTLPTPAEQAVTGPQG